MVPFVASLPFAILLAIAIAATAFAWSFGFFVADRRWHAFSSLAIGSFLVLFGYGIHNLGGPAWLVIVGPTASDFIFLWYVMRTPRKMTIAYATTWTIYIGLHMALSAGLHYDNLIPPWHLHG